MGIIVPQAYWRSIASPLADVRESSYLRHIGVHSLTVGWCWTLLIYINIFDFQIRHPFFRADTFFYFSGCIIHYNPSFGLKLFLSFFFFVCLPVCSIKYNIQFKAMNKLFYIWLNNIYQFKMYIIKYFNEKFNFIGNFFLMLTTQWGKQYYLIVHYFHNM